MQNACTGRTHHSACARWTPPNVLPSADSDVESRTCFIQSVGGPFRTLSTATCPCLRCKVRLQGVYDLQLAEVSVRRTLGHWVRFVSGFGKVRILTAVQSRHHFQRKQQAACSPYRSGVLGCCCIACSLFLSSEFLLPVHYMSSDSGSPHLDPSMHCKKPRITPAKFVNTTFVPITGTQAAPSHVATAARTVCRSRRRHSRRKTSAAPAPAPGQPAAPSPIARPRATPLPSASLSPPQHAELTVGNPVSPAWMDGLPFDRGRFSIFRGQKRRATQ